MTKNGQVVLIKYYQMEKVYIHIQVRVEIKLAGSDDIARSEEEIKADKENGNTVNTGDNQYGTTSSSSNQPQPTQEDEDRKQVDLSEYEANDLISEEPPVKEAEEYER